MTEVHAVSLDGDDRVLETDSGTLRARCLIVASGSSIAALGIPAKPSSRQGRVALRVL